MYVYYIPFIISRNWIQHNIQKWTLRWSQSTSLHSDLLTHPIYCSNYNRSVDGCCTVLLRSLPIRNAELRTWMRLHGWSLCKWIRDYIFWHVYTVNTVCIICYNCVYIYTHLHIESEYQVEANLCQSDNLLSTRLDAWGHHLCFFKVGCNWFNPQASTILSCGWRTTWCFKNLDKKAKECPTQKQRIICWSSLSAWSSWPPWVLPSWQIAHEVVVPNKIHRDCVNPATFRSATHQFWRNYVCIPHVYNNLPTCVTASTWITSGTSMGRSSYITYKQQIFEASS